MAADHVADLRLLAGIEEAAVARLGFLASMFSKPVLVGYITGVGLTLLSSQIAAFTGVSMAPPCQSPNTT